MRNAFCSSLVNKATTPEFIFLTGDLGYKALEPLIEVMGKRFINTGVAEQNMVSVAAGLARNGLRPWAYSIAPFIYARAFEQIRNDVCLHNLPVILVGNGGGYGYGVMGGTHHAIEDYGAMLCLPNMRVFVPAFDSDVKDMTDILFEIQSPCYFRLGLSEQPKDYQLPEYNAWRKLLSGKKGTLLVVGPLVGGILAAMMELDESNRPNIWLLSELPIAALPEAFVNDLKKTRRLMVIEEHIANGGAGSLIAPIILSSGIQLDGFSRHTAMGYPSGRYGSQKYHRKESGVDASSILAELSKGVA